MEQIYLDTTDKIYKLYGTDSGYLFGIPPSLRGAVEVVVKVTMRITIESEDAGENRQTP
jgi:hypothetical protein